MTASATLLDALTRQRPEWGPWLRVVEVVLHESEQPVWRDAVPALPPGTGAAPRLAGAGIIVRRGAVPTLLERLLRTAATSGTREMATLGHASMSQGDALGLFRTALCHDHDESGRIAARTGADPDALQAVAALLPVPFLQACTRSWGARGEWVEPYCPACGAWPAFAEVRGIERTRHYRCGRCGGDWHAHGLSCPFCATMDHRDLVRLVPADPGAASAVDACRKCLGYVKTFNRLQGCSASVVLLEDLRGVALDLAAIEQGYSRPASAGYALDVGITEQ
jgi:FdhE protein